MQYTTSVTLQIGATQVLGEVSTIDANPPLVRCPETCLFWGKRTDAIHGSWVIGHPNKDETLWDHHARMVQEVIDGQHKPWIF